MGEKPAHGSPNHDESDARRARILATVGSKDMAQYEAALGRLQELDREALVGRLEHGLGWDRLSAELQQPTVEATREAVVRSMRRLAVEITGVRETDTVTGRFEALVIAVADRMTLDWDAEIQGTDSERAMLETLRVVDRIGEAHRDLEAMPTRLGDFELLREIGRGGMGVVFEARQLSLDRRVALKVLPPNLVLGRQATLRFQREAHAAAKLHHTNIVPVHAIGEQGGHHFYAMDRIDGPALDCILADVRGGCSNPLLDATPATSRRSDRPIASEATGGTTAGASMGYGSRSWFDTVAALITEVAEALDYAHSRGVIHRDIKPANLLFSAEGRLSITDFGLARLTQEPGMTMTGALLGTPAYMSPEQVLSDKELDHRSDIYSLGAVLYEMLTLERAVAGTSSEKILNAILTQEPAPPRRLNPRIPFDLETICTKALEKNPDRRYQQAGEMAEDLRSYLVHAPITARRESPLRRLGKFIRRHPLAVTVAASALVVALLGFWGLRSSTQRTIEVARRSVADARYFLSQGEYRKGLEAIDAARMLAPTLPDARLMRARMLMMLRRHGEAVAEAEAMLAQNSDDWTAHLVLAAAGSHVPTIPVAAHVAAVETQAPESADAHYLRALLVDSPAEAIEHLDRALELDPAHAAALLARAQRHVDLKDFPAALGDSERLAAIRPRSSQGRRMIAWVHYNLHDPETALAEYERAIRLDPDDPLTYLWRAWVHKAPTAYRHLSGLLPATGRTREALADLTRAIELDPDFALYHRERADAHYQLGEYEDAIRDAKKTIELDPNDLAAYSTWGYACLYLGRREEIQSTVGQLAAALESWTDRRALADGLILVSTGHQAVGLLEQAFAGAERAIVVAPDYYQVYFWRAWLRQRTGDVRGAADDVAWAADLDVSDPTELLLRASGLSGSERPDLAFADLDRAVREAPHWADPYHRRAHLNEQQSRFEESLADYTYAISLAPRWVELFADRGRVEAATGRFDAALADFEAALEIDGQNAAVLLERADVWLRTGRIDRAFADIDRVVELNPGNAWAYSAKAQALFLSGRVEEALAAIEQAIEREPGAPRFHLRRAVYRLHGGADCAAAVADLDRARELAPSTWVRVVHSVARIQVADLAVVCPQAFDPAIALESARTVANARPRDPARRATLGLALYRDGRFADARHALEEALELETQPDEFSLFSLAMTESALGNIAEARSHYDRAVDRMQRSYPHHPGLEKLRREAERGLTGVRGRPHRARSINK